MTERLRAFCRNATPNRISPSSVVVSGTTYALGTAAAMTAVSYSGSFTLGDTVMLLLDRSGNVADIVKVTNMASVTGIVTAAGSKNYTNPDGTMTNSYYVSLLTLDGNKPEYQIPFDTTSLTGKVITVSFSGGVVDANVVSPPNVSGKIAFNGMTIGDTLRRCLRTSLLWMWTATATM